MSDKTLIESDNNPLSYGVFLNYIKNFKSAGTRNGDEFNKFDTPGHYFFRLLFYFYNGDNSIINNGGLLYPSWQNYTEDDKNKIDSKEVKTENQQKSESSYNMNVDMIKRLYDDNSAWAYLMLNCEYERAELLKQFVELLSNINMRSPWYFSAIEGLDAALERKQITDGKMIIEETRKKITIKCLPDAYDTRIATLLDLYKSVVWSWQSKKEILPANLRKFDMGLYIFSSPVKKMHGEEKIPIGGVNFSDKYANIGQSPNYITSYKYIEFHNCEIDYNSGKSGLNNINNIEGTTQEYSIDIYFDDCYENRYNEFMMMNIGDMILLDSILTTTSDNAISSIQDFPTGKQEVSESLKTVLEARSNNYLTTTPNKQKDISNIFDRENKMEIEGKKLNFLKNATQQLIETGKDAIASKLKSLYLGNIFSFSAKTAIDQIKSLAQGNVIGAYQNIKSYQTQNKYNKKEVEQLGNIFKNKSTLNNI